MAEEETERRKPDALGELVGEDGTAEEPSAVLERKTLDEAVVSINDYPPYVPEEENPDILIRGRWLERGCSAWWVSTAGTGKSIASVQAAYCWGAGLAFAGLEPLRPIRSWIVQSEDSSSRITIDREDITAELREQMPEVDWTTVGRVAVKFVKMSGKMGTAFVAELDRLLSLATKCGEQPDLVIINPFMAFVGGPVTDSSYVTPFLRGGEIGYVKTEGLQAVLERHGVGALIFHHTPKPPTEKEIDGWLKSTFPEYQGAGTSDITNWGRSFITMMKVKGHDEMVCMVAGKNGSGLGWEKIGGSRRKYMAWSCGTSIDGGQRHGWRELTAEEYAEVVAPEAGKAEEDIEEVAKAMAEQLKATAMQLKDVDPFMTKHMRYGRRKLREAAKRIMASPGRYHLTVVTKLIGRSWTKFVGLANDARTVADRAEQQARIDAILEEAKTAGGPEDGGAEIPL